MPASKADNGTEKAATASPGPGSRLRQAREAQGLSLEELGNELRIGAAALAALEENRFEALGATVFAKGYLKQYGTRLGLDVRELADLYDRAGGKPQVEIAPSRGIRMREERPVARWIVRTLLVGIVIGGIAYWWMQRSETEPVVSDAGEEEIAAPSATARRLEGSEPPPPEPVAASEAPTEREAGGDAIDGATDVVTTSAASDASVAAVSDTEPRVPDAVEVSDTEPIDTEPAAPTSAVQAPTTGGGALEVLFLGDSWAEITDEDGSRLYYDLGRAGARARFPADRNLNFYFGNASAVELRIDGELVPIPGAEQRDVVRFSLDELIN